MERSGNLETVDAFKSVSTGYAEKLKPRPISRPGYFVVACCYAAAILILSSIPFLAWGLRAPTRCVRATRACATVAAFGSGVCIASPALKELEAARTAEMVVPLQRRG